MKESSLFQSLHPAAEYHAAARAVGGCAIYVRYILILIADLCDGLLKKRAHF